MSAPVVVQRLFDWKVRGIRWIEIIGVVLVAAMVFSVYVAKAAAARESARIGDLERQIADNRQRVRLLRAEVDASGTAGSAGGPVARRGSGPGRCAIVRPRTGALNGLKPVADTRARRSARRLCRARAGRGRRRRGSAWRSRNERARSPHVSPGSRRRSRAPDLDRVALAALADRGRLVRRARLRARPHRRQGRRRHPRSHLRHHGGVFRRLRLPGPGRGLCGPVRRPRAVPGRQHGPCARAGRSRRSQRAAAGHQHHPLWPLYRSRRGLGPRGGLPPDQGRPAVDLGQAAAAGAGRRPSPDRPAGSDPRREVRRPRPGPGRPLVRARGPSRLSAERIGGASDRHGRHRRAGRLRHRTGLQRRDPRRRSGGRGFPDLDRSAGPGRAGKRARRRRDGERLQGRRRHHHRRPDGRDSRDGQLSQL